MIKKILKWTIGAPKLAFILIMILFIAALAVAQFPLWLGILLGLLFAFLLWANILNAPILYIQKAVKINNLQCDPFPILEQTKELLSLKSSPSHRLIISTFHCLGLINTGRYEEADALFSTLDIGASIDPAVQLNYYNLSINLASHFKREPEACHALRQIELLIERSKPQALKKEFTEAFIGAKAQALLLQGKPEEALDLLFTIQTTIPARLNGIAFLKGKAYFTLGNKDLAKMWLKQAIQTAGRMSGTIQEANELLKETEK